MSSLGAQSLCWFCHVAAHILTSETNSRAAPSEFGTYRLCEQRRFRRACASAQSRQNLRYSLIQAVSQEEPSDRKPDPWPLWMSGHAQLKFVMTDCSKTQIRLTGLSSKDIIARCKTSKDNSLFLNRSKIQQWQFFASKIKYSKENIVTNKNSTQYGQSCERQTEYCHRQNKWAATRQNQQNDSAPSEDSDQPEHPPSLIRDFAVRLKKDWALNYLLSAQWRLWSDWADARADLSFRWAHFVGFVVWRLKIKRKTTTRTIL